MVSRKAKNNRVTTEDTENTKEYDSNARSCLERLDLIAMDSLSKLENGRVRKKPARNYVFCQ